MIRRVNEAIRSGPYDQLMAASAAAHSAERKKELGAFYTPPALAQELVAWAIRHPTDRVLDPSFGSMVFLKSAAERLRELGVSDADLSGSLFGVDIDEAAFPAADTLAEIGEPVLVKRDFLVMRPGEPVPQVDAVVGNPPYLRYQNFNASSGCFPRLAAAASSVELTRLASSWAAFVVHAASFVAPGGRLAHVLPGQLLDAQYARAVREYLGREFGRVSVVTFEERVFPAAQEQIVLVCAESKGDGPSELELISIKGLQQLDLGRLLAGGAPRKRCAGQQRGALLSELLPRRAQRVYSRCQGADCVVQLGAVASVDIGTVTGANAFFLVDEEMAAKLGRRYLAPAISKAAHVPGARFTESDFVTLREAGTRCHLLLLPPDAPESALDRLRTYLDEGEALHLNQRNKCRNRVPWWSIKPPRQSRPDLFLTYCAHDHPRLVVNEAAVMNTNTLHSVVVQSSVPAALLAAGFYNSLTMLSSELLARSYGGGVLKLEPTEAEALLIPPLSGLQYSSRLLRAVDTHVRGGNLSGALDLIDPVVLGDGLGLTFSDIATLRRGADKLRQRRHARKRDPRPT